LKECHNGPLANHGGAKRTTTFFNKSYYWPNLKDSVEEYVKTCLTCQQNRTLNKKQAGLLQPLLIPEGSWESVSMDFMVSLSPSRGFDAIMVVVVDRFSKIAHFIPTKDSDVPLSSLLDPLEGLSMLNCGKLELEGRSQLPALKGVRGACWKSQD
jgi:hypothetical protein